MKLTAVHLIRVGTGPAAIRLQARGVGWVFGNFGAALVWRELDQVRLVRAPRAWALFIGLHGIRWARVRLPPAGHVAPPHVDVVRAPQPPRVATVQTFEPQLSVQPPTPP